VDEDELRISDGGQSQPDGLCAIRSARDDDGITAEDQLGLIGTFGRHGNDDAVDDPGVSQALEGMLQHRATAQIDECLRRAGS